MSRSMVCFLLPYRNILGNYLLLVPIMFLPYALIARCYAALGLSLAALSD